MSDLCEVCEKAELTGGVFLARLRTSAEKQHVVEGPKLCDPCARRVMALLNAPNLKDHLPEVA